MAKQTTTEQMPEKQRAEPQPQPKLRAKRSYHHGDLRRALLDAALITIEKEGVDAVRLNDLAKKLKVSVAAPFRHFASREDLLVAAAEEGALLMVEAINAASALATNPLDAERARGIAYVRFVACHRGYFRLLTRKEIFARSPLISQINAAQEATMNQVLRRGHEGKKSPALLKKSAGMLAAQAITYGLARMIDDGLLENIKAEDAEVLCSEVLDVLARGLSPKS